MNILVLNWRDIKNPTSGGAEILTHEMSRRWVEKGNAVIQFSARFNDSLREEYVDGVRIIRRGSWWTVHLHAAYYYLFYLRSEVDVVIDEVHWYPFFSVMYAKKKTILLACEVADKLFFNIFPYPLALVGRFLEKIYLSLYKSTPVLAISPSTKDSLIKEGYKKENITVLPMGLSYPKNIKMFPKEKNPTVIYLGRLNKQKGIFDALSAFSIIHTSIPKAKLWVVGSGREEIIEEVNREIDRYHLSESVKLFGFVDMDKKFELLSRAHVLIVPSVHEGWGLIVPEAGLVGTPSVVYNVSGLKDIVSDGENGVLVNSSPKDLADATILLLKDDKTYAELQKNAIESAKKYNWDSTAKIALEVIKKHG